MRKNTNRAARLALGVATLGGAGILGTLVAGSASAAGFTGNLPTGFSPVVGHVYLDDNTAGANTIGAFDRHADGSLTPMPGSPFPAGGAGTGAGLASQGALQFSSDGRYLLAVDAGSNQISVLRVGWDGSLQLVPGGVVSSGGPTPVSIAVHGGLVYVANSGAVGPNFTGFTLSPVGPAPTTARFDRGPARFERDPAQRLPARRRAVQLDRQHPRRQPHAAPHRSRASP